MATIGYELLIRDRSEPSYSRSTEMLTGDCHEHPRTGSVCATDFATVHRGSSGSMRPSIPILCTFGLVLARITSSLPSNGGGSTENLPDWSSLSVRAIAPSLHRQSSSGLVVRDFDLHIHTMRIHEMFVPIIHGSFFLSEFYMRILQECINRWAFTEPLYDLRIVQGAFEMTLHSTGGPIPWYMIQDVASNMHALTILGFAGTYDLFYLSERAWGVLVQFRIRA